MKFRNDFRFYVIVAILSIPFLSFGQSEWRTFQFDKNLSFPFPSDHERTDTLGQKILLARTNVGHLEAVKLPWPKINIIDEASLDEHYNAFQKSAVERSGGELISDSTIKVHDLYIRVFKFEKVWHDTLQVQQNLIVLINRSVYSFTYAYKESNDVRSLVERATFFSGITPHNVTFEDQLTIPKADYLNPVGILIGRIIRYAVLGAFVIAIILYFLKKFDQVRIIKRVLALTFLIWGGFCWFLYSANFYFLREQSYSFLILGGIGLLVGVVLRKIRIPTRRASKITQPARKDE